MKKLFCLFVVCGLFTSFMGCTAKKTYNLTFKAEHWWTEVNSYQIGMGEGVYLVSVDDKKFNTLYQKSGEVRNETKIEQTIAHSGDYVYVAISVTDVYDAASVECTDQNGKLIAFEFTDNLYIDENSDFIKVKKNDTIATKKVKFARVYLE